MSDLRSRELERRARAEGGPESIALLIGARVREGADDDDLSELLRSFPSNIHAVLSLTQLSEDRKALLEARMMIEEQITFALANAIQPNQEGDAALPTPEAVLASIIRTLTPAQAREILQFNEAKLVITPVTSAERYREELNAASQIMEGSLPSELSQFARNHLNAQATQTQVEGNKIKKWRFAITEGAQTFKIQDWDNDQESHRQRIVRFNGRFAKNGMTRLEYQSYIALMIQGLRQGKPIDCEYLKHSKKTGAQYEWQYTLVNEMDEERGLVGAGGWYGDDRRVDLAEDLLGIQHGSARFRPAVVGDIEI